MKIRRIGAMAAVSTMTAALLAVALGTGTGAAVPTPRPQALIGVCGGNVSGDPGTPVEVSVAGRGLLTIGFIPESGSAVLQLDGVPLLGGLLAATGLCSVTATAVQTVLPVVEPVLEPVSAPLPGVVGISIPEPAEQHSEPTDIESGRAAAPVAPASPVTPMAPGPAAGPVAVTLPVAPQRGVFDFVDGGLYDYSALLGGVPEFGALALGDLTSDHAPEFGILGADDAGAVDVAARDVAAAGRAQALDPEVTDRIALPVLVAVLMLAAIAGALLRSWADGAPR